MLRFMKYREVWGIAHTGRTGERGLECEVFRAGVSALFSELSWNGKILQIKHRIASVP